MLATPGLRTFDGAVAIVTGGASGIGRALAEELARRGAEVVVADLQAELAAEVAAAIRSAGGRASAETLDVTDADAFQALVQASHLRAGRLDYLFNNAGIAVGGEVHEHTLEDWRRVIDVDLMGVVYGVNAAYPLMIEQGFGHIVNTASIAGLAPTPMAGAYTTAKHGVVGLSLAMELEALAFGVRVSVLCPGVIRTPILVDGGVFGRSIRGIPAATQLRMWERLRPMGVERFARLALDAVARGKIVIVIPWFWRVVLWLARLSTPLRRLIGRRVLSEARVEIEVSLSDPGPRRSSPGSRSWRRPPGPPPGPATPGPNPRSARGS